MIPVNGISPFIPIIHVIISLRDTASSITSQSGACAATACQACDSRRIFPGIFFRIAQCKCVIFSDGRMLLLIFRKIRSMITNRN
ncbi:hypothetical protein NUV26_03875 [Burkholderia pseudomultivorans]|uniref:hypothetical protein n=1 Tax=Burkholderia pseudomultivorans TaxID=1207504 RepID=UPI0012DB56B4|nr:hypothetical protein [Burkholderia pseudomultivorans]MDS0791281.1 hypothetical protein [Burkholderia pseudomultivorans]